jgi:Holliday junction resolvase
MLNLYLDANTPEDLARALRAEGFEVVRAQEWDFRMPMT